MRQPVKSALLIVTLPLLASCGAIVGKFVPPQTFANPANLDGAVLQSSSALVPAAVKGTVQYDTTATGPFADLKYPDNVPFGMRPHAMKLDAKFTAATVSGTCTFPEQAKLTLTSFSASVSDSTGAATLSATPNLTVTLTKTSASLTSATYSISDHKVSVSADRATTDRAINILTGGGQNDAAASAQIILDQDGLAGCTIKFTLGNTSVTLSDFS